LVNQRTQTSTIKKMEGILGRDLLMIEVEMLKALFPDEEQVLKIENYFDDECYDSKKPVRIIITISPNTGMDDSSQFVSLQLCFTVAVIDEYPVYLKKEVASERKGSCEDTSRFISIPWRRGLTDVQCNYMLAYLYKKSFQLITETEDYMCSPPIYNLIEEAREYLTHENERQLEVSRCSVCLEGFSSSNTESIVKLPCFHIFHLDCLKMWYEFKTRDRYDRYLKLLDRDDRGMTPTTEDDTPTEVTENTDSPTVMFELGLKDSILKHENVFTCPVCLVTIPVLFVENQLNVNKDEIVKQYKKEKRKEEEKRKREKKRIEMEQKAEQVQNQVLSPTPPIIKEAPKIKKNREPPKGGWNGKAPLYGVILEGVTYSNQIGIKQKERVFSDLKEVARVRMLNLGVSSGKGPRSVTLMVEFISLELAEKFRKEHDRKIIHGDTLQCSLDANQPTTPEQE